MDASFLLRQKRRKRSDRKREISVKPTNRALSGIINDPMQMHLATDPRDMYRFDWSSTGKRMLASADRINVFDSKMRSLQRAYRQLKLDLPFRAVPPPTELGQRPQQRQPHRMIQQRVQLRR